MKGQAKCVAHGGKSPQALKRAEEQLQEARNPLMAALLVIALDERKTVGERLKAITWALERTGFKGGIEVNVEMPAWQQMLQREFGSSTEDDDADVIDAEVVEREPLDINELRAAMGEVPAAPAPDLRDQPNYVGELYPEPPARWGLSKGKGKRVRR